MSEKHEGESTSHKEPSWGEKVINRLVKAAVRASILVEDNPQPPLSETLDNQITPRYEKTNENQQRLKRMEERRNAQ